MKRLPISIQFFHELIANQCVYVDKTKLIHELINEGESNVFHFISRPRRFGKSLLISTLDNLFKGNKEVFKIGRAHV